MQSGKGGDLAESRWTTGSFQGEQQAFAPFDAEAPDHDRNGKRDSIPADVGMELFQGLFGNLPKSGLRFSTNALRPSWPSSLM